MARLSRYLTDGPTKLTRWLRAERNSRSAQELYDDTRRVAAKNPFPTSDDFPPEMLVAVLAATAVEVPPDCIIQPLLKCARSLYELEDFTGAQIQSPPPNINSIDGARWIDKTLQELRKQTDVAYFTTARATIVECLSVFIKSVPNIPNTAVPSFTVPLIDLLPTPGELIEKLIDPLNRENIRSLSLFASLRQQIDRNQHELSAVPLDVQDSPRLVKPSSYKGTDIVYDYLRGTPFYDLLSIKIPYAISEHIRFEHTHIIAGTGWGKSQTLQHLLLSDLQRSDPPALVVIDSQGEMLKKIAHLALFDTKLRDKLIYIDPADIEYPPALNMFDVSNLHRYGKAKREQFLNGLIELLEYVFAGLLKAELTQKQNVLFRYALRLMLHVPGATINDLVKFLNDPTPYLHHAEALSDTAQEFLRSEFPDKSYMQTRQQIRRRLFGVLENDAFRRMFTAPTNQLNMLQALNSGSIILVDTAKSHLKEEASSLLGRYFIALTLQAAIERSDLPAQERKSAFLYIDEAGEYFDDNIDTFLNETRKRRVGCVMAHQYLDQLNPQLRSSIATNTSIKLAGGISDRDAKFLAPEMRTSSEFIAAQKKENDRTSFACYVRNFTPQAISVTVPFGTLERQPMMSASAYEWLRQNNRARISMPAQLPQPKHSFEVDAAPLQPRNAAPPPSIAGADKSIPNTASSEDDWRS